METTAVENLLLTLFNENERIEEIRKTSTELYPVGLSPAFINTLPPLIFKHAVTNHTRLRRFWEHYVFLLKELYLHVLPGSYALSVAFLDQITDYIKLFHTLWDEPIHHTLNVPDVGVITNDTLFHLHAVFLLFSYEMKYEVHVMDLWSLLPKYFRASVHLPVAIQTNIIKAASLFCQKNCMQMMPLSDDWYFGSLASSMLLLLTKIDQMPYEVDWENNILYLSSCLSHAIESQMNPKYLDLSSIAKSTEVLAHNSRLNKDKAILILNLFHLLLSNGIQLSWLKDFMMKLDDSETILNKEILKTRLILFMDYESEYGVISENNMDIDQNSQRNTFPAPMVWVDERTVALIPNIIDSIMASAYNMDDSKHQIEKLRDVSLYTSTNLYTLLYPYINTLLDLCIQSLTSNIELSEMIASLYSSTLSEFIKKNIGYCISYALKYINEDDSLVAISRALEKPLPQICEDSAQDILVSMLMEEDKSIKTNGLERFKSIVKNQEKYRLVQRDQLLQLLAKTNRTKITISLAVELGNERKYHQAICALNELRSMSDLSMTLADHLSHFFMGILDSVNKFISQKRENNIVETPYILNSLQEIMEILGPKTGEHAVHLMKVFSLIGGLKNMQLDAVHLWDFFTQVLSEKTLVTHIHEIISGIIYLAKIGSSEVSKQASITLRHIIMDKSSIVLPYAKHIPRIPDSHNFDEIRQFLEDNVRIETETMDIHSATSMLLDSDEAKVFNALHIISGLLEACDENTLPLEQLYSNLIYLTRKFSHHTQIPSLTAICLGRLGATDPGLVNTEVIEDQMIVLDNFSNMDENRDFVLTIIIDHLLPAFNAATIEKDHQYIQYAIQALLQAADFPPLQSMEESGYESARRRWERLPANMQESLTPLLQSSYECFWNPLSVDSPIYPDIPTFDDWIITFYQFLTQKVTNEVASRIFSSCIPIIRCHKSEIGIYLLPYLVLHLVLCSRNEILHPIRLEILSVLELVNSASHDDGKRSDLALQVIVSITQHCREWMKRVKNRKRSTQRTQLAIVNKFLNLIPDDKMAYASLSCKAYAQALMHLEKYVKEGKQGDLQLDSAVWSLLANIYSKLNDLLGLSIVLGNNSDLDTSDNDLIHFQLDGKFDKAEYVRYRQMIENPEILASYTNYLDCFKVPNKYQNGLIAATNLPQLLTPWAPTINAYKMEFSWKSKRWDALASCLAAETANTPDSAISRALGHIKEARYIQGISVIQRSRIQLVQELASHSYETYRKSYPTIFRLQLLQDLEDIQFAWEDSDKQGKLMQLQTRWSNQKDRLVYNNQLRRTLIELRKAALIDIRHPLSLAHINSSQKIIDTASYYLELSQISRDMNNSTASYMALSEAKRLDANAAAIEKVKWYWSEGYEVNAFALLRKIETAEGYGLLAKYSEEKNTESVETIIGYYKSAIQLEESSEELYHDYLIYQANHLGPDDTLRRQINNRSNIIKLCVNCLSRGSDYVYSTMSMLINNWIEIIQIRLEQTKARNNSDEWRSVNEIITRVNIFIMKLSSRVPIHSPMLFINRLISLFVIEDREMTESLTRLVVDIFKKYPHNAIWYLMGATNSPSPRISQIASEVIRIARGSNPLLATIISDSRKFLQAMKRLAATEMEHDKSVLLDARTFQYLDVLNTIDMLVPNEAALVPQIPSHRNPNKSAFPPNLPKITGIIREIRVMKSLQKPKHITFRGSDGRLYPFLLKKNDDLRKDARVMEFNYMINSFFKKNSESVHKELYIRTYSVIPIGDRWGLLEWVNNLEPFKSIVSGYLVRPESHFRDLPNLFKEFVDASLISKKEEAFRNIIKNRSPPVFYKWFIDNFPEPNHWLASKSRYIKTLAVMSIVGYVLGLGDRHSENILFDKLTGDCVHVDLNMLFDKGLNLAVPELVPFRLTHNLVDAMGLIGYEGTFRDTCQLTFDIIIRNKEALLGVFKTFSIECSKNDIQTVIENKLVPKEQVKAKVEELITHASSPESLSQMYVGWAPFL